MEGAAKAVRGLGWGVTPGWTEGLLVRNEGLTLGTQEGCKEGLTESPGVRVDGEREGGEVLGSKLGRTDGTVESGILDSL